MVSLIIGTIITLIMMVFFQRGAFNFLEQKTIDWKFLLRGEIEASPHIVIISIDESSFSELNQKWPWPRTYFARLVDILSKEGAKTVGIDIIMSEPFPGNQDEELARSAKISGNVVFPSKFELLARRTQFRGKEVELKGLMIKGPVQAIAESGDVGYLNLPQDSDGFIRRFTPVRPYQGRLYTYFGLTIIADYLGVLPAELQYIPQNVLRVGDYSIPLNKNNSSYINFAGPSGKFRRISFYQVLNGQYPAGFFKGKIVLVGATFLDSHDFFTTPFFEKEKGEKYPISGVEICANIINTILEKRLINTTPAFLNVSIIFFGGILMTLLFFKLSPLKSTSVASFIIIAYLSISLLVFVRDILLVTMAPVLTFGSVFLAQIVFKYFTEEREKRHVRSIFQKYVSPDVVDKLIQDPSRVTLGGEEKILTVLFCDLVDFTTYSEHLPPHEMAALLSSYFTEMTDNIFTNQGTLKEYVGDEIMAIFGAPVDLPDHAVRACASALAMQEHLHLLRQTWSKSGKPALRARIGINSGPMLVGNLGSAYRFSYGVLGDHVNLGSRLEGLNKIYGTEIIIGENTARLVNGSFILREVDWVRVKGRKQPVSIYELIGRSNSSLSKERKEVLEYYAAGLKAFRNQCWNEALGYFERAQSFQPPDTPSLVMSKRCREYKKTPPQKEWDGVFQQISK